MCSWREKGTSDQRLRLRRRSGLKAVWAAMTPVSSDFGTVLAAWGAE